VSQLTSQHIEDVILTGDTIVKLNLIGDRVWQVLETSFRELEGEWFFDNEKEAIEKYSERVYEIIKLDEEPFWRKE